MTVIDLYLFPLLESSLAPNLLSGPTQQMRPIMPLARDHALSFH